MARQERVPSGDWMTVPPVATSIAPTMPTTFRVQRLPEILTSHQDTRLSGSLGHAVSADAPSGTIGGLTMATGSVSSAPAPATSARELREPAHHHAPAEAPLVAPVQRRLDASAAPTPLPVSRVADDGGSPITAIAPPTPALPEPAVSRVLASAPATAGRPLPVARVVDTGAPRTAPAASAAPASTSTSSSSSDAPAATRSPSLDGGIGSDTGLVGDERVGGFEVDLDAFLGGRGPAAADDDTPMMTPSPELLAPPIQRTPSRGATTPPPVQRQAESAAPSPSGPAPSSSTPSPSAPTPSPSSPPPDPTPAVQRTADAVATASTSSGSTDTRPTAGTDASTGASTPVSPISPTGDGPAPAAPGVSLPLARPSVQRSADDDGGHFPGDGHDHGDADVQRVADPGTPSPTAAPASTSTSTATAAPDSTIADAASPTPTPTATAPLTGDVPVARLADDAVTGPAATSGDTEAPASSPDLPLVARTAESSSATTSTATPTPAATTEGDDDGPATAADTADVPTGEEVAPTLGTDGAGPSTSMVLQTFADEATSAPASAPSALPLAPPEQPASLLRPTAPAPSASAGSSTSSPSTPSNLSTGGVGIQRLADPSVTVPTAGRPLVAQRTASGSSGPATTSAPAASVTRPVASSVGELLLSSPLTRGGSGAAGAGASGSSPLTVLAGPAPEADAVPLQRSFAGSGLGASSPSTSTSPSTAPSVLAGPRGTTTVARVAADGAGPAPVATVASLAAAPEARPDAIARPLDTTPSATAGVDSPAMARPSAAGPLVQRMAAPSAPAAPTAAPAASLPLHTAAAAVPSSTDLLVKAGLGERASDGSFLRSTPPAGVESSFTVQAMADESSSSAAPSVQRVVPIETLSTSVSPAGQNGGSAETDDQTRKLYRKLKAELEADIRRQLEAKSRFNRYRP